MKTTSFQGVCSLFLAFLLTLSVSAAETFQPHEILRVHVRSYIGFIQAMTTFTSQVAPQATGKLLFLSALPSMNPEFAAINLNRPITALLLTGAGTVKNKTGEYAPDLFLCAAVQLLRNADGKASTAGGVRYSRLSLPDGRTLLYEPNPLYDKMIRTKASTLFPVRQDLPMLYLEMDLASLSQLPFIRDGVSQAVASATVGNDDLQPEELTRELEKAIRQAEKISFGVNFPNEQTLEIKLGVTLKPNSETVRLFEGQKNTFDFSRIPILKTATEIYLLHIPDNQKLKDFLIRQVRQTTLPAAFLENCIRNASGAVLSSSDWKTGQTKSYLALRNGSARPLLEFMKKDPTIRELSPGLWIIDYQEDGVSTYAKVADNGLYLVSGRISEVTAKRILDNRTPLPAGIKLDSDFFAVFKKQENSDTFSRIGAIRYSGNQFSGELLLQPSDFPKPDLSPRNVRPSAGK